jgi:hypothetical protein
MARLILALGSSALCLSAWALAWALAQPFRARAQVQPPAHAPSLAVAATLVRSAIPAREPAARMPNLAAPRLPARHFGLPEINPRKKRHRNVVYT